MYTVVDKVNDGLIKSMLKLESTTTDTVVFRLHYKLTVWIVGFYSVMHLAVALSSSLSCMGDDKLPKVKLEAIQDWCWTEGTFSVVPSSMSGQQIHSGVGPYFKEDAVVYHHYYKWIYHLVAFMIIALLTPRIIWVHVFENGKMKTHCKVLQGLLLVEKKEEKDQLDMLAKYLSSYFGQNGNYAYGLLFCEFLNLLVTFLLLFIWEDITGHQLSLHTSTALSYLQAPNEERTDPLSRIFPVVAKCTFPNYGPSGSIQPLDLICVLPINVVNERAAIFFWFYFVALLAIGFVELVIRMLFIISNRLRTGIIGGMTPNSTRVDVELIGKRTSYADWHVLRQVLSNLEPYVRTELVRRLADNLREKPNANGAVDNA